MTAWSDEQQRLLRAMGYALYTQVQVSAPVPAAGSTATMQRDFSRLLRSLQLAATGRDVSALVADIAALHGDAAAKRALWPKLRALRSAGRTSGAAGRKPEAPDAPDAT